MQNLLKEQFPGYTELYMPETLDPLTAQFQFTTLAMTVLMLLAHLRAPAQTAAGNDSAGVRRRFC